MSDGCFYDGSVTWAVANFIVANNATWQSAMQLGTPGDTSWSFTNQNFRMDIKRSVEDTSPLLSLTSGAGTIVVDDPINRVFHFNVPESTITANLPVGEYVYDFVMYDGSSPPVRVRLMKGRIKVVIGESGG